MTYTPRQPLPLTGLSGSTVEEGLSRRRPPHESEEVIATLGNVVTTDVPLDWSVRVGWR